MAFYLPYFPTPKFSGMCQQSCMYNMKCEVQQFIDVATCVVVFGSYTMYHFKLKLVGYDVTMSLKFAEN